MANYVFEEMSDSDAVAFTSNDTLFFDTATVTTLGVVDNPGTSGPLGSTNETITLTSGAVSHTFLASQLAAASADNHLVFIHGSADDAIAIGNNVTSSFASLADVGVGGHVAIYGLAGASTLDGTIGNDTINGGAGNDLITGSSGSTDSDGHFIENDFLQGGAGQDTIIGGDGNDHIYGNLLSSTAGAADLGDSISAGDGNDYVNGNAGADTIDGGNGNDRLYGGADNDSITGGNGNDYLQGNKGNDTLVGGNGDDTLHGGAGNDLLQATTGNNWLFGDNGDDHLTAGNGFDTLTGGDGNDVFDFNVVGSASNSNLLSASTDAHHDQTAVVADYVHGSDHVDLSFTVSAVDHQGAGATFTTADDAQTYAQQLLTASTGTHGTEVAAIQVGADTYLFYHNDGSAVGIDSAVKLVGVTASDITTHDFV